MWIKLQNRGALIPQGPNVETQAKKIQLKPDHHTIMYKLSGLWSNNLSFNYTVVLKTPLDHFDHWILIVHQYIYILLGDDVDSHS